jgi:hypothetical protein
MQALLRLVFHEIDVGDVAFATLQWARRSIRQELSVRSRPDSDSHDLTLRPLPVVRSHARGTNTRTRNKFELVPSKLDYSPRLVRNGTCIKCIRCGDTTGCS